MFGIGVEKYVAAKLCFAMKSVPEKMDAFSS
jgi:hypothetical protein